MMMEDINDAVYIGIQISQYPVNLFSTYFRFDIFGLLIFVMQFLQLSISKFGKFANLGMTIMLREPIHKKWPRVEHGAQWPT